MFMFTLQSLDRLIDFLSGNYRNIFPKTFKKLEYFGFYHMLLSKCRNIQAALVSVNAQDASDASNKLEPSTTKSH